MKYLVPGHESKQRVELLLKFTNIRSENIKQSLIDHLVNGLPSQMAYAKHEVEQPHFSRALSRLEKVAELIEEAKELERENKK